MSRLNPGAVALWIFLACCGFLVYGTLHAAVAGVAIGVAISFLCSFLGL